MAVTPPPAPSSGTTVPVGVTSKAGSGVTVPVGVTSKAGYGVTITALVGAVLAYLLGDHSQAELGSIVAASVAVISLVATQVGRYVQANSQLKADANRLQTDATTVVHTINQFDPQAQQQLMGLVRVAVKDELANLPAPTQTVVTDLEGQLLPTADEEAAAQPPALAAGGGAP
jgi:membrane protein implicated in regulation of membrane protease activity